ncbi:MAG TPA: 3-oxoacid CoA-transferase subunit B, partial [Rhodocyclaceae bacterium]|nr:3-oxoacid CoA-transferase subunit B [Rhodocyclaceae bacterium]
AKMICSFPLIKGGEAFQEQYRAGRIALETTPQGTLAERLRAGGAGIEAFYTPTGVGTEMAEGKELRSFNGVPCLLEKAIRGDFALIRAHKADRWGNLVYRKTGRNFNPVMAMAARVTIAEVDEIVELGELDPEVIVTPGRALMAALTKEQIARRIARDLQDGQYVNLGFGIPTEISNHLPPDREIVIHVENGALGLGPTPAPGQEDPELVNAGEQFVTLLPGASLFHHADSFAMTRGHHVDVAVLGAMQVSERGDLANWKIRGNDLGGIGGAMDIALGAKNLYVAMLHTTPKGECKIVRTLSYPVTALGCVKRIYSDLAVIDVTDDGLLLRELAPGQSVESVQRLTEPELKVAADLRVIDL